MSRELRDEIIRARVPKRVREEIEADISETSNVLTLSDWLFEAAEERLARRAVRVTRTKYGKRMGQQ